MRRRSPAGEVPFDRLLAVARRHSRTADDAEDLVQAACLAAVTSGRRDFGDPQVMAWLVGTVRNLGALHARTAARRHRRDAEYLRQAHLADTAPPARPDPEGLPPALARTARLIAAGCTRDELRWLLGISDAALRQRLSALRRSVRRAEGPAPDGIEPRGQVRQQLRVALQRLPAGHLGSHDPDGHAFVIGRSHPHTPRQHTGEH